MVTITVPSSILVLPVVVSACLLTHYHEDHEAKWGEEDGELADVHQSSSCSSLVLRDWACRRYVASNVDIKLYSGYSTRPSRRACTARLRVNVFGHMVRQVDGNQRGA